MTNKIFLATTSLDDFWDKKKEILFAGEWCKLESEKNVWKNLQYQTFPMLWSHYKEKEIAVQEINITYKKVLVSLANKLNKYLDVENDVNYYELILGSWLLQYIHSNFDKFNLLKKIQKDFFVGNLFTITLQENSYVIPIDSCHFKNFSTNEHFRFQEFSKIIKFLKIKNIEREAAKGLKQKTKFQNKKNIKKRLFFSFLNLFKKKEITITNPYLSKLTSYLKLWRYSSNLIFNDFDYNFDLDLTIDPFFRNESINLDCTENGFEHFISENILSDIPLIYLEGHLSIKKLIKKLGVYKSKIFYSAQALHTNELFKFFIAINRSDIKLLYHQHGAGYGVESFCCDEILERSLADKFYTFGWSEDDKTNFLPVEKLSVKPNDNFKGDHLMILANSVLTIHRFFFMPQSSQVIQNTVNDTIKFLKKINGQIKVRFYPKDNGWSISKRISEQIQNLILDDSKSFDEAFRYSSLIITEHIGTTFYEAIASNKPIIAFINKDAYGFRSSAIKHFENLFNVGILHYSPEDAAKHYNLHASNISLWWLDSKTQKAVREFSNEYARGSKSWTKDWIECFNNELTNARR